MSFFERQRTAKVSSARLVVLFIAAVVGIVLAVDVVAFVLFLVVRGTPALLLYRSVLNRGQRMALAFYLATELPMVDAITTIAIDEGRMKPSTAAGLVGAAMLSTLIFPFVGAALHKRAAEAGEVGAPKADPATA